MLMSVCRRWWMDEDEDEDEDQEAEADAASVQPSHVLSAT